MCLLQYRRDLLRTGDATNRAKQYRGTETVPQMKIHLSHSSTIYADSINKGHIPSIAWRRKMYFQQSKTLPLLFFIRIVQERRRIDRRSRKDRACKLFRRTIRRANIALRVQRRKRAHWRSFDEGINWSGIRLEWSVVFLLPQVIQIELCKPFFADKVFWKRKTVSDSGLHKSLISSTQQLTFHSTGKGTEPLVWVL